MEKNKPLELIEHGDALTPEAMEELSNGKGDDEDEQQRIGELHPDQSEQQ